MNLNPDFAVAKKEFKPFFNSTAFSGTFMKKFFIFCKSTTAIELPTAFTKIAPPTKALISRTLSTKSFPPSSLKRSFSYISTPIAEAPKVIVIALTAVKLCPPVVATNKMPAVSKAIVSCCPLSFL